MRSDPGEPVLCSDVVVWCRLERISQKPQGGSRPGVALSNQALSTKPLWTHHFCGNSKGVRLLFVDMKAPLDTNYEKAKAKTVDLA